MERRFKAGDKVKISGNRGKEIICIIIDPIPDPDGDIVVKPVESNDSDDYRFIKARYVQPVLTDKQLAEEELKEFHTKLEGCTFTKLEGI